MAFDLNQPFAWGGNPKQGGSNTIAPLGGGNVEGNPANVVLPESEASKAKREGLGKLGKMATDNAVKGAKDALVAPLSADSVGAGMASVAEEAAINTALADATGAGLGSVAEQAAINAAAEGAATGAASSAASSFAGPLAGAAMGVAQGKYGQAAGSTIGGVAGSFFGPLGTMVGSALGGYLGNMTGYAEGTPNVQGYAGGTPSAGKSVQAAPQTAAKPVQAVFAQPATTKPNSYYGELRNPYAGGQAQTAGKNVGGSRVSTPTTPSRTSAQGTPFVKAATVNANIAADKAAQQAAYIAAQQAAATAGTNTYWDSIGGAPGA